MKRLLVLGCAVLALVLALRRPAPPPAIASVASPAELSTRSLSQHSRKGHPFAPGGGASVV